MINGDTKTLAVVIVPAVVVKAISDPVSTVKLPNVDEVEEVLSIFSAAIFQVPADLTESGFLPALMMLTLKVLDDRAVVIH